MQLIRKRTKRWDEKGCGGGGGGAEEKENKLCIATLAR